MSIEPLVIEFKVGVPPARAFEAWTRRCSTWWPASHTVSGDPEAITFEPRAGGRIVERARGGAEHDWGTVLDWQPPTRLRYRWQLFFDPADATEVEVTFSAQEDGTAVRLVHSGWDRLGTAGRPRATKTRQVWGELAAALIAACEAGPAGD
ncbi:MAG: SRPBCC domain-containing protein [Solirubrobacteraceae bacterium]|jgi:uncharacterized protein YndB with AHSA1/START domain